MKYITVALFLLAIVAPSYCFWSTGHMIVSRIAYEEIKKKDPGLLSKIEKEIDTLTQYSKEDQHSFVESAVWADDNKGIGWTAFNEWHFVDTPVVAPDFHGETEKNKMNATWAIYEMRKTLNNNRKPSFDSTLALSFAWRYLIHLVGDIHQPLHASTLYSKEFPNSDRGGNSFKVNYPGDKQIKNLHALWDACVDQYGSLWAPLKSGDWNSITQYVDSITSQFPRSKVQERVKILDDRKWAQESYEISKNVVYDGISNGDTPSKEYIERGRRVINEQLAVAGYRLADLMMSLNHNGADSIVSDLLRLSE